ncbi:MAG: SpoIIE family protein phosphatase [Gammaproteobacteria bacterium]|jgi:serine phosphatase RsbU (regulator of sigma subunit)
MDIPITGSEPLIRPAEAAVPRILVIEDDAAVRFNMLSYLEDSGFCVAAEATGEAGLEAIHRQAPDVVLCDLRLPGLDGLDVLQRLGVDYPGLPVVVVSGTGVLSDAVDALRHGASDFVTKPIQDMAVLEHAVDAALEKARLQRENQRFQRELERANQQLRRHIEQLEQDDAAGRNLQQQLIPPSASLLGYRLDRYLLPSLNLSGDFVDYFVIDATHLGFYLADVSGHGVSSAFVTVLLKSLVDRHLDRSYRDDNLILDPAGLLTRLNADLLGQELDKYATIFYGVIDTEANRLCFCNGGHYPAPVLFDGQKADFLDTRGYPVGMLRNASFENLSMALPAQHLLALVSDGVLDAFPDASLRDKRARLLRAVRQPGLDTGRLMSLLGLEPDGAYPDDITLLIAERRV